MPNPHAISASTRLETDLDAADPFMDLRTAVNSLSFFKRHWIVGEALGPVLKVKLAELAEADFDGQIRARVIYINQHLDKLKWASRNQILMDILPQFVASAERIVETIRASKLMDTAMGRRLAMLISTAFMTNLLRALPDTTGDGNDQLIRDAASAIEATWSVE